MAVAGGGRRSYIGYMVQGCLSDRAVVRVAGETARDFLQGLVTNDMAACAPGQPVYAGILTPQGKTLFEFIVHEREGAFLLDAYAPVADGLVKRLAMYRLRAKIEIERREDFAVAVAWDGDSGDAEDPRSAALGKRDVVGRGDGGDVTAAYHKHRLSLGVPDSADVPPDAVFALDAGFEELHGVSFRKGCYVGQEVTARMKHRASARRRFLIADVEGALPPFGTPLVANARELGTLATGVGHRAMALVRLDRLDDANVSDAEITAAGQRVTLTKPAWLSL